MGGLAQVRCRSPGKARARPRARGTQRARNAARRPAAHLPCGWSRQPGARRVANARR